MMESKTTPLSAHDRERLRQAAEMLLTARRTTTPIVDLPAELRPRTLDEAYYVQDVMLSMLGPAEGWKVGAPSPEATPMYAPLPFILAEGGRVTAEYRRLRGVEAEIAFLIGTDLPPRTQPYTREEVVAAIASCHVAMELLESALLNPDTADRLTSVADLQSTGGFIAGEAVPGWQDVNFASLVGQMTVDGFVRVTGGKNTAGSDVLRLVHWLANEAQERTGGLKAGQWVTTGSWTGKVLAESDSTAVARFPQLGEVSVYFE